MPWLGKLVSLSPYKIYNLIVNLMGVATATSDLPFITISEDLLEKLQNPLAFTKGREGISYVHTFLETTHLKHFCPRSQFSRAFEMLVFFRTKSWNKENIKQPQSDSGTINCTTRYLRTYTLNSTYSFRDIE